MKIGIIGTGSIGGTLARKLVEAGHDVRVANSRGTDAVKAFADEVGATAAEAQGAVKDAAAIILSIPFSAIPDLPGDLFDGVPAGVPVIDTGNYYPDMRDPRIADIDDGKPESVWVSETLRRGVVKAFNNILAHSLAELGRPEGASDRLAVAVAGDEPDHKRIAMKLVNQIGFDPVDAGTLADSWRQQPSTPAYCCDWNAAEMRDALNAAQPGMAEQKRDRLAEQFGKLGENPTHAEVVASNRETNAADLKA